MVTETNVITIKLGRNSFASVEDLTEGWKDLLLINSQHKTDRQNLWLIVIMLMYRKQPRCLLRGDTRGDVRQDPGGKTKLHGGSYGLHFTSSCISKKTLCGELGSPGDNTFIWTLEWLKAKFTSCAWWAELTWKFTLKMRKMPTSYLLMHSAVNSWLLKAPASVHQVSSCAASYISPIASNRTTNQLFWSQTWFANPSKVFRCRISQTYMVCLFASLKTKSAKQRILGSRPTGSV